MTIYPCIVRKGDQVCLVDNGKLLYCSDLPFQIVSVSPEQVRILEQVFVATHTNSFQGIIEEPIYDWAKEVTEIPRNHDLDQTENERLKAECDRLVAEKEDLLIQLQNQKQAKAGIFSDNKLLEAINKDLIVQVNRLKDVLLAVYSVRDSYAQENEAVKNDRDFYRAKMDDLTKENQKLQEDVAGLSRQVINRDEFIWNLPNA